MGREDQFNRIRRALPGSEGLGRHREAEQWLTGLKKIQDWFAARDEAAQLKLAAAMEQEAFDRAPYVPLGQIQQPTVYRKSVSDIVPASAPLFWNLRKG